MPAYDILALIPNSPGAGQATARVPGVGDTYNLPRSLAITGGTVTASDPLLNLTQTWNSGGVTFTGLRLNVTDTASASGSILLSLQLGGVNRFYVDKDGGIAVPASGFFSIANSAWITNGTISVPAAGAFRFSSTTNPQATTDVILLRDAANTLALRNSTAAQAFRVYNTWTDASNGEWGAMRFNSNALEIGAFANGTGTVRDTLILSRGSQAAQGVAGFLNTNPGRAGRLNVVGNTSSDNYWTIVNDSGSQLIWNGNEINLGSAGGVGMRHRTDTFRTQFGPNTNFPVSATSHTFTAAVAADVAFAVRGTTSQTGDLTRWLDVSNTVFTRIDSAGRLFITPPSSITPSNNGEWTVEMTSNTAGNLVYRGSDGTTRRCALTFV
jgi:hypothetical protein